jgi:hypothetical protein
MTLLQQQKSVNRTAEKAAAHHRKDNLAEWLSTAYSSRLRHHASFREEIAAVDCLERRSPLVGLLTSPS